MVAVGCTLSSEEHGFDHVYLHPIRTDQGALPDAWQAELGPAARDLAAKA